MNKRKIGFVLSGGMEENLAGIVAGMKTESNVNGYVAATEHFDWFVEGVRFYEG